MVAQAYELHRSLLQAGALSDEDRRSLLAPVGFADWRAADARIRRLAEAPGAFAPLAELLPYLLIALRNSAHPDRALVNVERWLLCTLQPAHLLRRLIANPRELEVAITLFAGSQFLTDIFLRNSDYVALLAARGETTQIKSAAQFESEAMTVVAPYLLVDSLQLDSASALDPLRHYQHRELLRIGLADLCGLLDLATVTAQLSHLAVAMVRTCLTVSAAQLDVDLGGFCVLAMGKLGGAELNYSSDIDLLFLAEANASAYQRLGEDLIRALSHATSEGFLYRVDMRLRPWGGVGPLVSTLEGHLAYLERHARPWERQALLKARVIAGSERVGGEFLRWAAATQFAAEPEVVRADVHAMKQRTEAQLRLDGRGWGEVKLGEGSIRDVEFITQYLQLAHGARHPEVRSANTLDGLARLTESGLLRPDEGRVLVEGYVFLRTVEHYLQILDYRQTNTLPGGQGELAYLAQRLGFQGSDAAAQFAQRYQQQAAAIRTIYAQHLAGARVAPPATAPARRREVDVGRHLSRLSDSYTATFSDVEVRFHATLAERLSTEQPVQLDAVFLGEDRWRLSVIGFDYPGVLSLICGLLFVHGFSIFDGQVFTYEPPAEAELPSTAGVRRPPVDTRRKIVDVFTVHALAGDLAPDVWERYGHDLRELIHLLQAHQLREAQGALARRVASALARVSLGPPALHPIELEIDNDSSERHTILKIDAPDTVGFLYEFTNALALNRVYIDRVVVNSAGNRVQDLLYVTDSDGRKITDPERQRELHATTLLVKHFTHMLPQSPNPESALLHFHEYLGELLRRPGWPDELATLERPEVLDALARLLGVSDFLWDDFLRMQYANLSPIVRDLDALAAPRTRARLAEELDQSLGQAAGGQAQRDALNAFKDREMFRSDVRYILGHLTDFTQFSRELTDLAEVVLTAACRLCDAELRAEHGAPMLEEDGPSPYCLAALGKCGGRELGFASDIELMFIYAGNGVTSGPASITSAEYYEKLVSAIVRTIRSRREGMFAIDLQLRPYGGAGSLAVSLAGFRRYFAPEGAAWNYERQALIKLRIITGDAGLGAELLALRDEYVFSGAPFDLAAMRAMRERQIRHLVIAGSFNAKFSLGGLVDVEYLVQGLQIMHGQVRPEVRSTNTLEALDALQRAGVLEAGDYDCLRPAYSFLWRLVEALRVVRGNAKDLTLPTPDAEEFAALARRLGYGAESGRLLEDLQAYTACTQRLAGRFASHGNGKEYPNGY